MNEIRPANFLPADNAAFRYLEKANPRTSNLRELTYGTYELSNDAASGWLAHPREEALLFCVEGQATVSRADREHPLERYDVVYLPRGTEYQLTATGGAARLVICRAPAEKTHPFFLGSWKKFSADEKRVRRLQGKNVFLMFDVSESADRLMAGYSIFQPRQRSWPPHNHTDQEEVYIFTRGRGAMEVYADEQEKWFVRSVEPGDAVTIPLLNYHPVFSHEEELHFIWCISGNRYWVGDKNKDFMTGKVDRLTT